MNLNKALWGKGDFTKIAALMRESGEALVKSLGVTKPLRVLDLGCGDGTTAVPLALLGAEVVGMDRVRHADQRSKWKSINFNDYRRIRILWRHSPQHGEQASPRRGEKP